MGSTTDFQLTLEQTTHHEAQWDDNEELVYVDPNEPVKTYGSATGMKISVYKDDAIWFRFRT